MCAPKEVDVAWLKEVDPLGTDPLVTGSNDEPEIIHKEDGGRRKKRRAKRDVRG